MRYETRAHRGRHGLICTASETITTEPASCPRGCYQTRNFPLADGAPRRLDIVTTLRAILDNQNGDVLGELSAESTLAALEPDQYGAQQIRLYVSRNGETYQFVITVDGDL